MYQKISSVLFKFVPSDNTKRLLYIVILVISLAFIGLSIFRNWEELRTQEWNINYMYVILSIIAYPIGMLPTVGAWHTLLNALGKKHSFRSNLRIYSISSLPRHIPGFVWFVTSRSVLYSKENTSAKFTVTATGVETVLLASTGFITSLLLLTQEKVIGHLGIFRLIVPIALLIAILFIFSIPYLNQVLKEFVIKQKIDNLYQVDQKLLILSLVWMFLAWAGGGVILSILVESIYPITTISLLPVFIGIWGAAGAVSLTIGIGIQGFGIREVTMGALLSLVMPTIIAITVAVAFRLVLTLGEIIWVSIFMWLTKIPSNDLEGTKVETD